MSRRCSAKRRAIGKDSLYGSELVQKFINKLMEDGKKSKAENIFYRAIKEAETKLKKEPMEIFNAVIKNVMPVMEVKSRRVGGSTYQVPIEVKKDRGEALAMRWLKEFSRKRKGSSMAEKLAQEFIEAYQGEGVCIKKKEDVHKMAAANKAFAHFRW